MDILTVVLPWIGMVLIFAAIWDYAAAGSDPARAARGNWVNVFGCAAWMGSAILTGNWPLFLLNFGIAARVLYVIGRTT